MNRSFNEILLVIKVVVLVRYKLIFLGCAISITSYFFYLFYMHLTIAFLGKLYYNNSNEIIIIDLEKIVKKNKKNLKKRMCRNMKKLLRKKNGQWLTIGRKGTAAVVTAALLGTGASGVYLMQHHDSHNSTYQEESVKQNNDSVSNNDSLPVTNQPVEQKNTTTSPIAKNEVPVVNQELNRPVNTTRVQRITPTINTVAPTTSTKVKAPKVEQPKVVKINDKSFIPASKPETTGAVTKEEKVVSKLTENSSVPTNPTVNSPKVEKNNIEKLNGESPKVEQPKVEQPKVEHRELVTKQEVVKSTIKFGIQYKENPTLKAGVQNVLQAGKDGVKVEVFESTFINNVLNSKVLKSTNVIPAVTQIVEVGTLKEVVTKVEQPKVETPKVEQPKVETPKVEQPKVETPKVEQPKVETPKVEQPKVETPKVEQPKVETPKVEQPKVETPKVEQPKVPQTTKRVNVRTETIVYKTEARYNNQLAQGTRNVLTVGKNGSYKVVRDDIYEGDKLVKQGTEQNIDRIEAVNEVVEIGTKVPQTTKRVNVRTETIAYKTETRYNNQLAQGTRNVLTVGKNGSYKVVRDDIYEGDKLVKQGTEQNIDRIEAVNEVVEIGTKVPQTTSSDTYFVLDTENNWFVTSEQTAALTKIFGKANGNVDVEYVVEKLKDPENYKLFNSLNLGQYFNKVNNPAGVQKMINDYALKNQLEINKKFIALANAERVKAGLAPAVSAFENTFMNKKVDAFVQDMSNERAKEMADYGSLRYLGKKEGKHKRPDGRSWYTVYSDKGIDLTGTSPDNHRYNMAGENALQGNWGDLYFLTTPDAIIKDAFDGWMASPGHRALILNDVPHPIFAFSYRQGLKDYLGSKNKPTVAMLHVTSWFNPLDYPVSKAEYEKWKADPKNKDNVFASDEYYNFLKANTKNK